jgi:hypothetical protein
MIGVRAIDTEELEPGEISLRLINKGHQDTYQSSTLSVVGTA